MFASLRIALAGAILLAFILPAAARENPYDIMAKVLTPLLGVFSEKGKGDRAVSLSLRVEEATGLPTEVAGAQADLAIESPDRLRVSAPLLGPRVTLCRQGKTIWVHPGSALKALLESPEIASKLPEPNRDFKMKPFKLPIPTKHLVFLPALFQVRDAGDETIDGQPCQGIDVQLMSELAKSLKVADWSAILFVDEKVRPVRLTLVRDETRLVLRFDKVDFARSLPPETWAPNAQEAADVLIVPPARYDQLLRAMMGERPKKERKEE